MKQLIRIFDSEVISFRNKNKGLKKYLIPIREGFYGFSTVLSIILIIRFISVFWGNTKMIDLYDLMLAGVGFFLMSLESFIKKFN